MDTFTKLSDAAQFESLDAATEGLRRCLNIIVRETMTPPQKFVAMARVIADLPVDAQEVVSSFLTTGIGGK